MHFLGLPADPDVVVALAACRVAAADVGRGVRRDHAGVPLSTQLVKPCGHSKRTPSGFWMTLKDTARQQLIHLLSDLCCGYCY